ncbi:hypothetical protein ACKWTF_011241 [Chironomus riparius]
MEDENKRIRKSKLRQSEIRSLTKQKDSRKVEKIKKPKNKIQWKKYLIFLTSLITLIIAFILYQLKFGSCEFWNTYERNYNKIVYGDEKYCYRKIDTNLVNIRLLDEIVGQDDAIELIKGSLNLANNDEYIQMIFHGVTGIGKTLASEIIARNFPNPTNVQKYIWKVHEFFNLFEIARSRLSKCGFNLIILDDLEIDEYAIELLKDFEQQMRDEGKRSNFRIVLLAIFKDTMTDKIKDDLKNFVIIDFNPLSKDDFIKCIEIHLKLFNITMNAQEFEELKEIDYSSSGCKLISKKLVSV